MSDLMTDAPRYLAAAPEGYQWLTHVPADSDTFEFALFDLHDCSIIASARIAVDLYGSAGITERSRELVRKVSSDD